MAAWASVGLSVIRAHVAGMVSHASLAQCRRATACGRRCCLTPCSRSSWSWVRALFAHLQPALPAWRCLAHAAPELPFRTIIAPLAVRHASEIKRSWLHRCDDSCLRVPQAMPGCPSTGLLPRADLCPTLCGLQGRSCWWSSRCPGSSRSCCRSSSALSGALRPPASARPAWLCPPLLPAGYPLAVAGQHAPGSCCMVCKAWRSLAASAGTHAPAGAG